MKFLTLLLAAPFRSVYDGVNNVVEGYPDAYNPSMWANESIAILEENMVVANLVHRDFEPIIANYGDVVNTRKPGEFVVNRKTTADSVTVQTPTATSVPVVLNQHLHTSFMIMDGDQSKSFKDLVVEYLSPAMLSIARGIDQIVSAQVYQFLSNQGGQLNQLSGTNAETYLLGTRQVLNKNKAYVNNRNLVLSTVSETALLSDKNFTQAFAVGDEGTALREASLGRKYGFDIFMAQNMPYVDGTLQDIVAGAINNAAGAAVGATSLTVDGLSATIAAGTWLTVAGDNTPVRVVSTTGGATPTAIVITPGLKTAALDNAVVTLYRPAAVNNAAGYAVGWVKPLVMDGVTNPPQVGQLVSLSATGEVYGIIEVLAGGTQILLDRPLETAVVDNQALFLGPNGSYNWAFHRNSVALVTRPLALPMQGTGARAGIANFNNLSMRVVMTYNGTLQGTLVTLDTLLGVKVLDKNLGAVMLG